MALRLPDRHTLETAAASLRLRERQRKQQQEKAKSRWRWLWLCLAAVAVAGLMMDLRDFSQRMADRRRQGLPPRRGDAADILRGLDDPRYQDPSGWFSVVPPRHWVKVDKPVKDFYNVVFQGPYGMDMAIRVTVTNNASLEKLAQELRRIERRLSADTHMDITYIGPYQAIKRSPQLFRHRILILDFLTGDLAHHVQFSIPPELYEEYEPVFLKLMQTYQPGQILPMQP